MKKTICIMLSAIITTCAAAQPATADEQAIHKVISTMETAWMQKKGEVFASGFADVHDYIVWNGYYFPNWTRQANASAHQGLFDGVFRNVDIQLKIDKIRFLRNDLALVHVYSGSYEKGKSLPENPEMIISMIMEKKKGNWQIVAFHNLDLEAFRDKATGDRIPMPVNVMYAGWYKK